jgi:DNA-damage-inducible protein D
MTAEMVSLNKGFEDIKHLDDRGFEFWWARELLPLLGYENWNKAEEVVARAARACINSGQDVDNHIDRSVNMVKIGSNTLRKVKEDGCAQ